MGFWKAFVPAPRRAVSLGHKHPWRELFPLGHCAHGVSSKREIQVDLHPEAPQLPNVCCLGQFSWKTYIFCEFRFSCNYLNGFLGCKLEIPWNMFSRCVSAHTPLYFCMYMRFPVDMNLLITLVFLYISKRRFIKAHFSSCTFILG